MYKVDLHTHSTASPDGGISKDQYRKAIESGLLDVIAVTDHNRIDVATDLNKELGERIIVGEEIMTSGGEIVGLFLNKEISSGMSPLETVKEIKDQGGLVYIPHPFETIRKGLHPAVLEELVDYVDIIEVYNGRAFAQNRSEQAVVWAKLNRIISAASSDAHGFHGLGHTFTTLKEMPARDNLLALYASGIPNAVRPKLRALLYPKYHKLKQKMRRQS